MPRKFDHDKARKLREEGLTLQAIADRLGVSAVSVWEACAGIKPPILASSYHRRWDRAAGLSSYIQGATFREVAAAHSVSQTTARKGVRAYASLLGVDVDSIDRKGS